MPIPQDDDDYLPFCDDDSDDKDDRFCYYGSGDDEDNDPYEFDCGFIPGHGCQLAGTEDCDFDCPYAAALQSHPDYPNVTLAPSSAIAVVSLVSFSDQLARSEGDVLPEVDE